MTVKNKIAFYIITDEQKITVNSTFSVDSKTLWKYFSSADCLDLWWATLPWITETKRMDFSEGGSWIYGMKGPNGEEHLAVTEYIKIEPYASVIYMDAFLDGDGKVRTDLPQSVWNIKFEEGIKSTNLIVEIQFDSEFDLDTVIEMGFKEGFIKTLNHLHRILHDSAGEILN